MGNTESSYKSHALPLLDIYTAEQHFKIDCKIIEKSMYYLNIDKTNELNFAKYPFLKSTIDNIPDTWKDRYEFRRLFY